MQERTLRSQKTIYLSEELKEKIIEYWKYRDFPPDEPLFKASFSGKIIQELIELGYEAYRTLKKENNEKRENKNSGRMP